MTLSNSSGEAVFFFIRGRDATTAIQKKLFCAAFLFTSTFTPWGVKVAFPDIYVDRFLRVSGGCKILPFKLGHYRLGAPVPVM